MELTQLLNRIQQGDANAFAELIKRYGEGVYRRAFRQSRDRQFSVDITRQTLEELFARLRANPDEDAGAVLLEALADKHIDATRLIAGDVERIGAELAEDLFGSAALPPPRVLRANSGQHPAVSAPQPAPQPAMPPRPAPPPPHAAPPAFAADAPERVASPARARQRVGQEPPQQKPRPPKRREPAPEEIFSDGMTEGRHHHPKHGGALGHFVLIVILIALCCILLWMAIGILMKLGVLPSFNLGYNWFNQHIVMLF